MTKEEYLIHLYRSAICGTKAELPETPFDWVEFAKYAEVQQLENLIYPQLKGRVEDMVPPEVWHHMHQRYGFIVRRDMIQDMEVAELCDVLSEKRIMHIPLKGSVIKKYYPLPDLRRSSDLDILIHPEDRKEARRAIEGLGFKLIVKGQGMDDPFKRGKTRLELHNRLRQPFEKAYALMKDVWENVEVAEGYTYQMQPEFLWTYLLAHLHHHLCSGGGGIKLITDFYVLRNAVELNREKLSEMISIASLNNLNESVSELVDKWFYDKPVDNEYSLMIEKLILSGGAYGDADISKRMSFSKDAVQNSGLGGKIRRLFKYAFPNAAYLKIRYPILEKYPILLPIMWIVRFADTRAYSPKTILKAVNDTADAEILSDFQDYISL